MRFGRRQNHTAVNACPSRRSGMDSLSDQYCWSGIKIQSVLNKIEYSKFFISLRIVIVALCIMFPFVGNTQSAPKPKRKVLCNPLVLGSIPKKALSFQYEMQSSFSNNYSEKYGFPTLTIPSTINSVLGFRFNYNKNLITKPKTYVTLDIGYWFSKFNVASSDLTTRFMNDFNEANFHSITTSSNVFKPINSKNFILINASIEFNGNGQSFQNFGTKNIFAGGAVIYGWKKGLTGMTGVGLLRAYRLGRVVHVPAFLMNKTFNKKWGVEMLLPARAVVRYVPNKKNIVTAGFDLEGGQFAFASNNAVLNNTFFQRGEIRPKIGWERELSKNLRFTTNVGTRINGRMNIVDKYDSKRLVVENSPFTNLFVNVGFHIVSLKAKPKKK